MSENITKPQVGSKKLKDLQCDAGKHIQLSTLGTPLPVTIGDTETHNNSSQLSAVDLVSMQTSASLSDQQLFNILRDIRFKFGRKVIESNIKSLLVQRKTIFSVLFSKEIISFRDSKGNSLDRPFVFCHDTQEIIDRIRLLRDNSTYCTEDNIGFDDGKEVLLGTNKFTKETDKMKNELELYPFVKTNTRKTKT